MVCSRYSHAMIRVHLSNLVQSTGDLLINAIMMVMMAMTAVTVFANAHRSYVTVCTYLYIIIQRERGREREATREWSRARRFDTVDLFTCTWDVTIARNVRSASVLRFPWHDNSRLIRYVRFGVSLEQLLIHGSRIACARIEASVLDGLAKLSRNEFQSSMRINIFCNSFSLKDKQMSKLKLQVKSDILIEKKYDTTS